MSARLIPPPQLHLHRITQYSQKNTDTTLLRAPSELSENRTEASVRTVLGRALVRRRKQRCASYTNTAVRTVESVGTVRITLRLLLISSRSELEIQNQMLQPGH